MSITLCTAEEEAALFVTLLSFAHAKHGSLAVRFRESKAGSSATKVVKNGRQTACRCIHGFGVVL